MQRFYRLGSVGFGLILVALTFHLVAISFDRWTMTRCEKCTLRYLFKEWRTSIQQRCYRISMLSYLDLSNDTEEILNDPFTTYVCVPNLYLYAKDPLNAAQCLGGSIIGPHNACTAKVYSQDLCKCDYTKVTKAVNGLAIVSCAALSLMVLIGHFATYIEHDFILKWLIPTGFFTLIMAFISMCCILVLTGLNKKRDSYEIVTWRLLESVYGVITDTTNDTNILSELDPTNFTVSIGISFGMEIIAAHFTLISAVIYALMFLAKKRPNS